MSRHAIERHGRHRHSWVEVSAFLRDDFHKPNGDNRDRWNAVFLGANDHGRARGLPERAAGTKSATRWLALLGASGNYFGQRTNSGLEQVLPLSRQSNLNVAPALVAECSGLLDHLFTGRLM